MDPSFKAKLLVCTTLAVVSSGCGADFFAGAKAGDAADSYSNAQQESLKTIFRFLLDHAEKRLGENVTARIPHRHASSCGTTYRELLTLERDLLENLKFEEQQERAGHEVRVDVPTTSTLGKTPPKQRAIELLHTDYVVHWLVDLDVGAAKALHELSHLVDGYCGWRQAPWESTSSDPLSAQLEFYPDEAEREGRALGVEWKYFQLLDQSTLSARAREYTRSHDLLNNTMSSTTLKDHMGQIGQAYGFDYASAHALHKLHIDAQRPRVTISSWARIGMGLADSREKAATGFQNGIEAFLQESDPLSYVASKNLSFSSTLTIVHQAFEFDESAATLFNHMGGPVADYLRGVPVAQGGGEQVATRFANAVSNEHARYNRAKQRLVAIAKSEGPKLQAKERQNVLGKRALFPCEVQRQALATWVEQQKPGTTANQILETLGIQACNN